MRIVSAAVATLIFLVASVSSVVQQNPHAAAVINVPVIPGWAYPVAPAVPAPKDDGTIFHVPNSTVGMTFTQARRNADVPDWHPDEHPPIPDVVRHGRIAGGVRACVRVLPLPDRSQLAEPESPAVPPRAFTRSGGDRGRAALNRPIRT